MIALQLYTVRDLLKTDYAGTLDKLSQIGYRAVETAGEYNGTPAQGKALFDNFGLRVCAAHGVLMNGETPAQILDLLGALGTETFVCAWQSPESFASLEAIQQFCERLNEVDTGLRAHGARLAYHNHDHEFRPLPDGSYPLLRMLNYLNPSVLFEVDTYWVQVAGANVATVLQTLGNRAPLLHIKDGPGVAGKSPTAVGDGVMDFSTILTAHTGEWQIIELDNCDTDMLTAVERSYQYLSSLLTQKAI